MGFLDKVTKAVGEVVDKGKKDVDLFMKVQKINGEIGGMEKKIAGFKEQINQAKAEAGGKAIGMLRAGTLTSPELQTFLDQIIGLEQQIRDEEAAIAGKKADIDQLRAEHEAEHAATAPAATAPAAATAPVPPPPVPEQPVTSPVVPPPLPVPPAAGAPAPDAAAGKFCTRCGEPLAGSAFCPQCGAKQ